MTSSKEKNKKKSLAARKPLQSPLTAVNSLVRQIEDQLAQTQCRLCQYEDCHAYADAIVNRQEAIHHCQPGGEKTLAAIASIMNQALTISEFDKRHSEHKPMTAAIIREAECIGCTKCIQACPVDAIIGSAKQMHTVFTDLCNGCERCLPACPVDCIETITHPQYETPFEIADQSKQRYQARQLRLEQQVKYRHEQHHAAKQNLKKNTFAERQAVIQAAVERFKAKSQ